MLYSVWPDWAIYWTLGKFIQPLETINLPKSLTFLGNFWKYVKIFNFSTEIIFGQLLLTFGDFFLVTLVLLFNTAYSTVKSAHNRRILTYLTTANKYHYTASLFICSHSADFLTYLSWIINRFACLSEYKPVKQEASYTVILPFKI